MVSTSVTHLTVCQVWAAESSAVVIKNKKIKRAKGIGNVN